MEEHMTIEEYQAICSAGGKLCDYCDEHEMCYSCMVARLLEDAYAECPEAHEDEED